MRLRLAGLRGDTHSSEKGQAHRINTFSISHEQKPTFGFTIHEALGL